MRTTLEFPITVVPGWQLVSMPEGFTTFGVVVRNGVVTLIALADESKPKKGIRVVTRFSGDPVEDDLAYHVGSVVVEGALIASDKRSLISNPIVHVYVGRS